MKGKRKTSAGDGIPMGTGFLAHPEDTRFGVKVPAGFIGE
jgi:hypothetical protein